MKNVIIAFFFGAIVSSVFVSFIYNYISKYQSPYLTSFSLLIIFGFLTYISYILFKSRFIVAYISILLPVILIDASVLITYPALVPMRFPIASIFPLLGGMITWAIIKKKYLFFFLGVSVILIFIHGFFVYPKLLYRKMLADQAQIEYNPKIFQIPLLTINRDTVRLGDTLKANLNLVELFFVGCIPCEQKSKSLKYLTEKYDTSKFLVISICSGVHTPFNRFLEYTESNRKDGFIYLYSPDSSFGKLYGYNWGFPFEQVFTSEKKYVSKEVGFNIVFQDEYLKNKIKQIEKYAQKY